MAIEGGTQRVIARCSIVIPVLGDDVAALGELAFVDEIDAGVALQANDLPLGGAQVVVGSGAPTTCYFAGAGLAPAGSFSPANTGFRIGFTVRRYAKIAFKSSSVMFW